MNERVKRITLVLDVDDWRRLKHFAVDNNKSLTTYLKEQLSIRAKNIPISTPEVDLQQNREDDDANLTLEERLRRVKDLRN